ncbi:MAG: DUF1015 domain-containing protein [Actinomycetota bacterium]|nr:DUF1015 domain-containing protein [Actinomycetota bacterium]
MPTLRAFRGIRYATSELGAVVCPPYDVISPEEQSRLYERHEHNAVRLELARTDGEGTERYAQVQTTFTRWVDEGVLAEEDVDALYVYRQDFSTEDGALHRVAGVLGALELEAFGRDSGVLPHERTMAGPKEDRLALMRACPVNISPIYAIYRGGGGIAPFLTSLENRPPQARFQDEAGILHRLWVITAPAEREMLAGAVARGPLVIADGHHRYETALAFHEEQRAREASGDHGSILCFCVDADSEDLVVLPYHRALRAPASKQAIAKVLTERFAAEPVDAQQASSVLERDDADHSFVFAFADGSYLARVGDADVIAAAGPRHASWRALDVVALHEVVLPAVLGEAEPELRFSRDANEILASVRAGEWDAGILLRAVAARQVVDVASSGERMPQKASYFWPKAVTGLVFHSLS